MGISGLLPALKSITETKPLEEYRGKTLAIDGYCWCVRVLRHDYARTCYPVALIIRYCVQAPSRDLLVQSRDLSRTRD